MHPELFTLPFVNLTIQTYGLMIVLGFLAALFLARRLCRRLGENPDHVTNFCTYAVLFGIIGARLFHVIHNWADYRDDPKEIFAIWTGGLEFVGGFVAAFVVMVVYFRSKKLSILKFLDILAPALMLGLSFGRIGCFCSGCCFGAPSDLPWAVRFPTFVSHSQTIDGESIVGLRYSTPFYYQIITDRDRRCEPLLRLADDYYDGYTDDNGHWVSRLDLIDPDQQDKFHLYPKQPGLLTSEQLKKLGDGTYQMTPIHPAQLYSSVNALILCLILYLLFRRRRFNGQIFAFMLIFYGIARFFLESLRNDSPLEFDGLTISQNISLIIIPIGLIMLLLLRRHRVS